MPKRRAPFRRLFVISCLGLIHCNSELACFSELGGERVVAGHPEGACERFRAMVPDVDVRVRLPEHPACSERHIAHEIVGGRPGLQQVALGAPEVGDGGAWNGHHS